MDSNPNTGEAMLAPSVPGPARRDDQQAMVDVVVEAARQAVAAQQATWSTSLSAVTMGVATLYSLDTASTGESTGRVLSGTGAPGPALTPAREATAVPPIHAEQELSAPSQTYRDDDSKDVLRIAGELAQTQALFDAVMQQRLDAMATQAAAIMTIASVLSIGVAEISASNPRPDAESHTDLRGQPAQAPVAGAASPTPGCEGTSPESAAAETISPQREMRNFPLIELSAQMAVQDATRSLRLQSSVADALSALVMARFVATADPAWLSGMAAAQRMARDALAHLDETRIVAERMLAFCRS